MALLLATCGTELSTLDVCDLYDQDDDDDVEKGNDDVGETDVAHIVVIGVFRDISANCEQHYFRRRFTGVCAWSSARGARWRCAWL